MLDYVRQRPSPTSSFSLIFISFLWRIWMCWNLFSSCLHGIETSQSIDQSSSLRNIFQLRQTQIQQQLPNKKFLRIIYYRDFDSTIDEIRLKSAVKNLTESYNIDLKIQIFEQSQTLSVYPLCSLLSQEQRDTIIIADLYTKEIDFISRALKIPTIAYTNRYQIVQGKLHNPYLFKLMPDPMEEAKTVSYVLETRSVYNRIALIYDTSLDMVEYRLSYLRLARQHIVYRAQLPRVSLSDELRRSARTIIYDLIQTDFDLILCVMSTERQLLFVDLIKETGSLAITNLLFNRTSWWFTSSFDETHGVNNYLKTYTFSKERQRTINEFLSGSLKVLLNAVVKTYLRLLNTTTIPTSSSTIGPTRCDTRMTIEQLRKTHTFIKLFANYTEWNCDLRTGSGIEPILFDTKTLAWRIPTIFIGHKEHSCEGMLTRVFTPMNSQADHFFRSCRSTTYFSRRPPSLQQDNSSSSLATTTTTPNALVDLRKYHVMFGRLWKGLTVECRFVHILAPLQTPIVIGVVEPPYIFVSDAEISSDFDCNHGFPCHQIDPFPVNATIDALYFYSKTFSPPHCCYGISINLLLRMDDSNSVATLKTKKLFVFADKPNKWMSLIQTLKNRRAHLAISPIPYESFLARSIDLSPPFYHSSYVIFTAAPPTGPSLGAFLQPFSWATWFVIFLVLNATALFETFFEWHSPYGLTPKGRRRQKVFSLASALTLSWSIIFSHTFKTKSPKCWSNRFLGNVWGGFGIVFIAIYTAKLAAFMVETADTQSAMNVHEIVNECNRVSQCSIGVVANTSDEEYIRRFFLNTLYTRIKYVSSYSQGIEALRAGTITHLLMDHSMARYYLTREVLKGVRVSHDNFGTFGLSLGFSKFDSELRTNITNVLLSYVDTGMIQRLHDDWYVYENCERKRLNDNQKLNVDRFFGVFILLAAGIVLGSITLLLEWLTFKYGVPYLRKRQWLKWMFCSQRLYAAVNVSNDTFNEAYRSSKTRSFRTVGERLHNYSTRSDSLDLRVVDVPKLLCTTYQLKEQMTKIHEQQESPLLPPNGDVRCAIVPPDEEMIRTRIDQLEDELQHLRLQLSRSNLT